MLAETKFSKIDWHLVDLVSQVLKAKMSMKSQGWPNLICSARVSLVSTTTKRFMVSCVAPSSCANMETNYSSRRPCNPESAGGRHSALRLRSEFVNLINKNLRSDPFERQISVELINLPAKKDSVGTELSGNISLLWNLHAKTRMKTQQRANKNKWRTAKYSASYV